MGGAETYARAIVPRLPAKAPHHDFTIVLPKGHDANLQGVNARTVELDLPVKHVYRRVIWEHTSLTQYLKRERFDLVHFLGTTASIGVAGPAVVTVHETLRFQAPESAGELIRLYYSLNHRSIVRRGFNLVGVSGYDTAMMRKHLHSPIDKTHVAALGGSERFENIPDNDQALDFLWIGHPYPHKNVPLLIESFAKAQIALQPNSRLRLVGLPEREQSKMREVAAQFGIQHRVSLHGKASERELRAHLDQSAVVCLPSSCESFGLPILEGLSCGRSIACSPHPALNELYAGHVFACSELTSDAYANALISAQEEYIMGESRDRHRQFAKRFNWDTCAQTTANVYDIALKQSDYA